MKPSQYHPARPVDCGARLAGVEAAEAMIGKLGDSVTFYKIGYQLAYAGDCRWCASLPTGQKFSSISSCNDIGNTVARGVESVAKLGATFLTVHAYPQTMKAAVEARAGSDLKILAVTVLTSYDDGDLHAAAIAWASPTLSRPARSRPGAGRRRPCLVRGRSGVLAQDRRPSDDPGDAGRRPAGARRATRSAS